jgi:processive 1,2-diacylglycerol beta-glucosyltransferase
VVVLTDFDVHGYWVQPTADRFFVGSGEVAAILAGRGIEERRIEVSGIPIAAEFGATWDREAIRARLGLDANAPVVLVTAGGAGVGSFADTVSAVLASGPAQVLAVCGRNEALKRRLEAVRPPAGSSLHSFGFVSPIAELMAVADLAVAKSGADDRRVPGHGAADGGQPADSGPGGAQRRLPARARRRGQGTRP